MLDELRQKPKHIREQYALLGALGITFLVAVVWGLSLSFQLKMFDTTVANEDSKMLPVSGGAFSRSYIDVKSNMASAWASFIKKSSEEVDGELIKSEPVTEVSTSSGAIADDDIASSSVNNLRPILIATTSINSASSTE